MDSSKKRSLIFDVDWTLTKGYHPSIVLEHFGINIKDFWAKVTREQEIQSKDRVNVDVIYITYLLHEVQKVKGSGLTIEDLNFLGENINDMLYPGLPEFFDNMKEVNTHLDISYHLLSVGLKDMLKNCSLARYCNSIDGYDFLDGLTPGPGIDGLKSTSSSHEKVSAIVKISRGELTEGYECPIKNMIYFGDGHTDIPAFSFVKRRGGTSICVFDPEEKTAYSKAEKFRNYVNYILPVDYRKNSDLWCVISDTINK